MTKTNNEKKMIHEFADFIEAEPVSPGRELDNSIINRVKKDLRPAAWKVYGKFTLVEAAAGLLTLTICPQFGLGFGQHNEFLHTLHTATPPVIFYLICGLFFVSLGAVLSGLILTRVEIRTVGNNKYLYFAVYSVLAYLTLMVLGAEFFVVSSLVWILGALLGNILSFETIIRLRQATT